MKKSSRRLLGAMIFCLTVFLQDLSAQVVKPAVAGKIYEKVYLHTDREIYAAGETLWYAGYLVDAVDFKPSTNSLTLYVELINPASKIISKQTIRLEAGTGHGDFQLPDSLSSGVYRIRAYTNWMLNEGDRFLFSKKVTVSGKQASTSEVPKTLVYRIGIYPEGGYMVDHVSGRVAVKAEQNGKGIQGKGYVISSRGDTAAAYTTNSLGMGSFFITPDARETYRAVMKMSSTQSVESVLPTVIRQGLSMFLQEKDSVMNVVLTMNDSTFSDLEGKKLYLMVRRGPIAGSAFEVPVTGTQIIARIKEDRLPEGINSITLYDEKRRPQCERLIFIPPQKTTVKAALSSPEYTAGKSNEILLTIQDAAGNPLKGAFSTAITDASLAPLSQMRIDDYLMLQSEIRGQIEHPERYFDESNANRKSDIDLLLLTQGWRDFIWRRVADSVTKAGYFAERGLTISGSVLRPGVKQPSENTNVSLRLPKADGARFFATKTDSLGNYYFDDLNIAGQQPVILAALNAKGEPYGRIRMDTLGKQSPSVVLLVNEQSSDASPKTVEQFANTIALRKSRFRLTDTIALNTVLIEKKKNTVLIDGSILQDFGYPEEDFVIQPRDAKDYRNLLHYLLHRSNYSAMPTGTDITDNKLLFRGEKGLPTEPIIKVNGNSLFIQDGLDEAASTAGGDGSTPAAAASHDDFFAGMTMDQVERIHIQKVMRSVAGGAPTIAFVLSITTKPGALDIPQRDKIAATVDGYYQARSFYSPSPGDTPDLRKLFATVLWEPNVQTDSQGKATITFKGPLIKIPLRVDCQGITQDGQLINSVFEYKFQ